MTTYWNGEPASARRVLVTVAAAEKHPLYWANQFVGTKRKAVEVDYFPGEPFYLDDEDGSGWAKVTDGKGSPRLGHRNLYVSNVEERSAPTEDSDGA